MTRVEIALVEGPIAPGPPTRDASLDADQQVGSRVCFEGIVRGEEDGRPIAAIDYEIYEPMASRMLEAIAREEAERPGICSIEVVHSRGRVGAGEVSFRCVVRSRHRAEGLAALASFIERMKRDVPIWKRPEFDGAR